MCRKASEMAWTKIVPMQCKTLLLKHKYLDDWFLSRYGMNLYRACKYYHQLAPWS
ncbi:hypothetical protein KAU04_01515 [bacterium]|nr:hypothetical protein [bacterium]MCK4596677.1 hypothetical protein [bacterium]